MKLLRLISHVTVAGCILCQGSAFTASGRTIQTPRTLAATESTYSDSSTTTTSTEQPVGDILILDHLNINHEEGRHDWLNAFYFDFLGLAVDPRKEENYKSGQKTVWANAGAQQFHLPEGTPNAQVLSGQVVLVYPDLTVLQDRVTPVASKLDGSQFAVVNTNDDALLVTDPWGSSFRLEQGASEQQYRDPRGLQPGALSECLAMRDLTIYTPVTANLDGIARFYQHIFDAPVLSLDAKKCVISVGPKQTLTFETKEGIDEVSHHVDLRQEEEVEGMPSFLSNYGPHISMYVADLPACYRRADELGLPYVNPRFKRRAYNLEQAVDDCMFRCIDIVDPERPQDGVILQLEHEVRSVVKRDGSLYKSCPFDEVPDAVKKSGNQ
ncbi:expressed unknown protein [Seminavis robusta]|uniref:VOC domain-containing protein n=1 Tax=Seminavis robusta TaxID=568900 RepID=A0A9N8HF66_9STRA|nr:expressed unknown protein [Seminavis robusta]|eukprot:Sro419_g139140.1 n/a (382) ;mRNA; f:49436-50581